MLKLFLVILVACVAILLLLPKKRVAVECVRVERGDVEDLTTPLSNAVIQADRYARIKAVTTGEIQKIHFRKGARVKEDALIIKLRDVEESARLALAEANLAAGSATLEQTRIKQKSAGKELDRATELFQSKLLSQANYDQVRTEVEMVAQALHVQESNIKQLAAQLEIARSIREKTFVRAPFDGMIADIHVEEGEYLLLGVPLYDIYDDNSVYVTARFDEIDASRLKPGMQARMNADALVGRELHGVIQSVSPVVDTDLKAGRGVDVRFTLTEEDPEIRIGMSVDIEVVQNVRQAVPYLPTSLIQGGEGGRFVLVVSQKNRAEKRTVVTGFSNWDRTEILSGVDENDQVISSVNLPSLKEGVRIEIKK